MTNTEMNRIIEAAAEELRKLPSGTEITSCQLLKRIGYDPGKTGLDLYDYHTALFREAEKDHIILDMSKHDDRIEGLPWNLDFVVRNNKE